MATEALVTDQTAEAHVVEMKLAGEVKNFVQESCSQSKDLEGKDKEKIDEDDSASIEATVTKSEAAITSEEMQGDEKTGSLADDGDKEAKDDQTSDSLAINVLEKEETPKLDTETSATAEPTIEADVPEPPKESTEESETVNEPAATEVAAAVEHAAGELKEAVSEPAVLQVEAEEENTTAVIPEVSEAVSEPAVIEVAADEVDATEVLTEAPEVEAKEENTTEVLPEVSEAVSEPAAKEVAADEANTTEELTEAVREAAAPQVEAKEENTTEVPPDVPKAVSEPAVTEVAADEANAAELRTAVPEVEAEEHADAIPVLEAEVPAAESPIEPATAEPEAEAITTAEPQKETITTADVSETAEMSQEEPVITDPSNVEVSADVTETVATENVEELVAEAAPVAELKEVEEVPAVPEEVPSVPEIDSNPDIQPIEEIVKPKDKVEEGIQENPADVLEESVREKTVKAEEPTFVDTAKTEATEVLAEVSRNVEKVEEAAVSSEVSVESSNLGATTEVLQGSSEEGKAPESVEVAEEKSEAEKTTLNETSRDVDLQGGENNEKTVKVDEQAPAESAKDGDEAPKVEVPVKSSQRQSSNIFSKVKQSIVKVKKAIIGKSPSSKTMTAESKDEVKVK